MGDNMKSFQYCERKNKGFTREGDEGLTVEVLMLNKESVPMCWNQHRLQ